MNSVMQMRLESCAKNPKHSRTRVLVTGSLRISVIMDEVERVKIVVTDTTRKLSVRKGQVISDICKVLDNGEPHFVHTDEDGDSITAFSEQEMEDAIFKDTITKCEWKGTGGASAGGEFGPQDPSKSQAKA